MDVPLSARAALLQALAYPGHGRELIDRVRRDTGGSVVLKEGSVYPALRDLEARRLLRRRRLAHAGPGRPVHSYELTLEGVAALEDLRRAITGLFGPAAPTISGEGAERMQERLRRCEALSTEALSLQRAMKEARR